MSQNFSTNQEQTPKQKAYILCFCLLTALIPILSVEFERSITYVAGIISLVFYGSYRFVFNAPPVFSKKILYLIIGALSFLLIHTIFFAKFQENGFERLIKLSILLPLQVIAISLAFSLNKAWLRPYIPLFSYGVMAGCCLLFFELATGGTLYNVINNFEVVNFVRPAEFNRASIIIVLYFFSAISFFTLQFSKKTALFLMLIPLLPTLYIMDSQSAQLAFIVGCLFVCLFPYKSSITWLALKIAILIAIVATPFIVSYLYQNHAQNIADAPFLSHGYAGHRLEIWDSISRYALQSPIYGHGIEATRQIKDFSSEMKFHYVSVAIHPHNFILQIWLELGVIGIVIAALALWKIISYIQYNFNIAQQKILLPTLMAALVPASTAYNIWQGWWIALLFHVLTIAMIACKFQKGKLSL